MARPDGPVELMRELAAAASSAAITSTSVARSSVISIAVAHHLSGGGHTPVRACSGSAVQAGSSKTFLARQAVMLAASILRIQCGTAVSGCLGNADTRG